MTKIDDLTRLKHIEQAIVEAISFVEGRDRRGLEQERMLSLTLVKLIEMRRRSLLGSKGGCCAVVAVVKQLIIFLSQSKINISRYLGEG